MWKCLNVNPYMDHLRLSCQNRTAFQCQNLANRMIAVCHGNNLQGEKDENTMGMGRHASRGEMMGSETGRGEERET